MSKNQKVKEAIYTINDNTPLSLAINRENYDEKGGLLSIEIKIYDYHIVVGAFYLLPIEIESRELPGLVALLVYKAHKALSHDHHRS